MRDERDEGPTPRKTPRSSSITHRAVIDSSDQYNRKKSLERSDGDRQTALLTETHLKGEHHAYSWRSHARLRPAGGRVHRYGEGLCPHHRPVRRRQVENSLLLAQGFYLRLPY